MTEVWLRSNRRVLLLALVPVAALAGIGALLVAMTDSAALRIVGAGVLAASAALAAGLVNQLRRPRIAYRGGEVLFYLRSRAPVAAPVEVVEAFFLGQGPAHLPVQGQQPETVNLVARISQKAPDWAKVDVKPALGNWCEGYVTIRGTWCEPLHGEVIRRLNRRLREVREAAIAESEPPRSSQLRNDFLRTELGKEPLMDAD